MPRMKWVLAVILAAAVAAGVYFGIRTQGGAVARIAEAPKQAREWTPENIAADPEGYLAFAEAETEQELRDLASREASLRQVRNTVQAMLDEAGQQIELGSQVLEELKTCYKHADTAGGFPVMWRGENRSEPWLKQNIVSLHPLVESKRQLRSKLEQGLRTVGIQADGIVAERGRAQQALALIKANRELLKADRVSRDMTTKMQSIAATIQAFGQESDRIDLDRLAIDNPPPPDAADFRKIMEQK